MLIHNFLKSISTRLGLYPIFRQLSINYHNLKRSRTNNLLKIKWRLLNNHNYTGIGNTNEDLFFPINKVSVGNYSYGLLRCITFNSSDEYLKIGHFCSIGEDVRFIMGGQHHLDRFSTYPFNGIFNKGQDAFSKGPIIIEDDVWIGYGSIILSGVTLAKGTVVAAGSVVIKSTQPYAIIGGNPAQLIKYRFDETTINILMKIDFGKLSSKFALDNHRLINESLEEQRAAEIYSIYQDYLKDKKNTL